jgi:hypothetical protein
LADASHIAQERYGDAQRQPDTHLESVSKGQAAGAREVVASTLVPTRGEGCAHPVLVPRDRIPLRATAADLQVGHLYIAVGPASEVHSLSLAVHRSAAAPVTPSIVQMSISRT